MRSYSINFFYRITLLSGFAILSSAKISAQQADAPDTSKLLSTVSKNTVAYKTFVIAANVEFPQSLQNYKDEAADYVEKFSSEKRTFLLHTYETGKKYFPKIITVLKRYQLPEELKVLIALESGFSANAISKAGAVGYWQIMDEVAKEYGLQIVTRDNNSRASKKRKDERKNFMKSTIAAAKYFSDRMMNLNNDLLLMVASYNCGIGTVKNAINKSPKTNPDFWDIKKFLPKETRNYVMNFIALNVIFTNYENFVNRQMLFAPKMVTMPVETPEVNNSIPFESINAD